MAVIRPFRALRYHPRYVPDLSLALAPPYDVIDARKQEQLYDACVYNVVRLILGRQFPDDTETRNRYTRARWDFDAWRSQGALSRDPLPALYLVAHEFTDETGATSERLGFLALLGLAQIQGAVLRHEATLAAPKEDRAKLLEAVPANLSPVFGVYPDADGRVSRALQEIVRRASPSVETTWEGSRIRLWVVSDPTVAEFVGRALEPVAVLIADGHHRFEVAYARRESFPFVMGYFVSMRDPGLRVRPIHRLVQGGSPATAAQWQRACVREETTDARSLMAWLGEGGAGAGEDRFGYSDGRTCYRVRLNPEAKAHWLKASGTARAVAELDVSLLHGVVLPALGVTKAAVGYTPDPAEALAVAREQGGGAWLLRPIPLARVYDVAAQGHLLPPKSTYFYPKVPSGLAINPCEA